MKDLFILGLTGPSGAGKSEVARVLAEKGLPVVDADALVREVQQPGSPCLAALAEAFSPDILLPDGSLDRKKLAELAFISSENTHTLNHIVHPAVIALSEERFREAAEAGAQIAVLDAPLLFESGMDRICDRTVAVLAPAEERLRRIRLRDGITEEQAKIRMGAQPSDDYYTARASLVIRNDGEFARLRTAAEELAEKLEGWRREG